MRNVVTVVYEGESMPAGELAQRIGVSQSCIAKRWLRGMRGADLVKPSQQGRPGVPRAFEGRCAIEEAEKIRKAEEDALKRRLELRQRAKDAATKARQEHAVAFARPLIDDKLVTPAEQQEIASRVKGRQRWNSGWFGESKDTREMGL